MDRYKNLNRSSGVVAYEIAHDSIRVKFIDGAVYVYTYASAGWSAIETMKALAAAGKGLSTFIARHAKDAYDSKFH